MDSQIKKPALVHGTADLLSGNREDLFQPYVTEQLINIVCRGCGLTCENHELWEDHIREMTLQEDEEHADLFNVQITSNVEKVTSENFRESAFKKFNCPECGRYFKTEDDRDSHRMCVSTSVKLICPQCNNLAPDMELHLSAHAHDVKCGECGDWCGQIDTHMVDSHSGYLGVLVMQTAHCAGDGTGKVTREVSLATNARFLATEVKPVVWEETNAPPDRGEHFRSYRFNKASEREKALAPPDSLPQEFFDKEGKRIWSKLPSNAHQCELCGYTAVTKNKYREKQDHVSKWHFAKRLEMIIPLNTKKPFLCPDCPYTGKDRQCVLRHYTGKHAVLELWTNEFLQAMNNKTITPKLMYLVENVNFNAGADGEERSETVRIQKTPINRKADSFHCILCKDEPSFASKKGLALHVEMAHAHSRQSASDFLLQNNGFSFKEVIESSTDITIEENKKILEEAPKEEEDLEDIKSFPVSDILNQNLKRAASDEVPSRIGDVSIVKKKRRPPPGLIRIGSQQEEEPEESQPVKTLDLGEIKDQGLFCIGCSDGNINPLQSFAELKNHILKNHLEYLVERKFVSVKNFPANHSAKPFSYYLCTSCGKCLSQSSSMDELKSHGSTECSKENKEHMEPPTKTKINKSNSPEKLALPPKLATMIKEISPSISIIPKPAGTAQSNMPSLFTKEKSKIRPKLPPKLDPKLPVRDPCPCEYCNDPQFATMRLHKCYAEPGCDKTFTKIAHLKAHIRCHKNERPFVCEWQDCGKTFVRPDELKRHAWIHTKEDRFKCSCGKGYSRADHFRAHMVKCDSAILANAEGDPG